MKYIITLESKNSKPRINYDPSVQALYIQFSEKKVAKTIDDSTKNQIVAIDIDDKNELVGVEIVGVKSFSIGFLAKQLKPIMKTLPDLTNAEISLSAAS